MLRQKLKRLVAEDAPLTQRITVDAIDDVGIALYEQSFGTPRVASPGMIQSLIASLSQSGGQHGFSNRFLVQEWVDVVDAWQLDSWEAYGDVARLGRRTRLAEKHRATLWPIFAGVRERL